MSQTRLMLLWHMHQPYYKDLAERRYAMPWVRLHALKDYYGMVAMMREFPAVHLTFNLVPSLVAQILDYASGGAQEESYDLAFKPAGDLSPAEKATLVKYAFQVNHENLLSRYPRFQELLAVARGGARDPRPEPISGTRDLRDLQVLSQLAWLDEIYLESDPELRELAARQRDYTEADKLLVKAKEAEILKATLEEYRAAQSRGQVELSTTPFYHPILPLLCDTDSGADSSPGLPLPRRFRHPEDAHAQLRAAVDLHRQVFGVSPSGLWPSEGSVSEEALELAAAEGFKWAATDEGVLSRSLRASFRPHGDGSVEQANQLYQPRRFQTAQGPIDLFFRDHPLSDLIGFIYARMDPAAAAHDLLGRIRHAAGSSGLPSPVVSIILDGENAWEYYPGNGREFLKRFYGLLSDAPDLRAMTPGEILAAGEPPALPRLIPGSWINANFNVWIGAEEDNRAWNLLSDARDFFEERSALPSELAPDQIETARQELWIAEGSDWCWWYGPEHSSANDEEFDRLYRKHLGNLYHLLGGIPPDELAEPLKRPRLCGLNVPPSARIAPVIDGRETTYFEWLGAGVYTPDARSASLHESGRYIRDLYYGRTIGGISLRIDMTPDFLAQQRNFELHLKVGREDTTRVHARIANNSLERTELWLRGEPGVPQNGAKIAYESIFEAELKHEDLGLACHQPLALQVSVWVDGLPVEIVPREGWLAVEMVDEITVW